MTRPARAAIVATYHATFPTAPDWPEGPMPFRHGDISSDTTARSTYYSRRTARLLYGTANRPRRWHKTLDHPAGQARVIGLEAIRLNDEPNAPGIVAVHFDAARSTPLTVVRALARREGARLDGFDPQALLGDQAVVEPSVPYTLTFVTSSGRRLPRLYRHPRYALWPTTDQWLWALASRTNGADHPPDPRDVPGAWRAVSDFEGIRVSADWRGLVLRSGIALVGCRSDAGAKDSFYNHAEVYVHSIYLDAVLIGILQFHGIGQLEDALASALDDPPQTSMAELERRVTIFRNELWWQHLSTHGVPNQLLGAYQRQHRLHERFDRVLTEISDFNRMARDNEKRHVNNALVLFTLTTVPISIALALLQALGSHNPWTFGIVLASCVVLTAALLATRTARVVLRSIRKRLSI
jgi:hypothetical protein